MSVWVGLEVASVSGSTPGALSQLTAVINTGYEARSVQLITPVEDARTMGLWPPPADAVAREYFSASTRFRVHCVADAIQVRVQVPEGNRPWVRADLVISPATRYSLISDALASALQLVVVDPAGGLWTFRDQMDRTRPSQPRPAPR